MSDVLTPATSSRTPPPPGTARRALFDMLARHEEDPKSVRKVDLVEAAEAAGIELSSADVKQNKPDFAGLLRDFLGRDEAPEVTVELDEDQDDEDEAAAAESKATVDKGEDEAPEPAKAAPPKAKVLAPPPLERVEPRTKKIACVARVSQRIRCCGQNVRLTQGQPVDLDRDVYDHLKRLNKVKRIS